MDRFAQCRTAGVPLAGRRITAENDDAPHSKGFLQRPAKALILRGASVRNVSRVSGRTRRARDEGQVRGGPGPAWSLWTWEGG